MAGACCLAVECDPERIEFRRRTGYVDETTDSLDRALAMIERWTGAGEARSVGLLGNAADVFPELVRRGAHPDIVTDQTSAHDPINGYLPKGWTVASGASGGRATRKAVERAARASMKLPGRGHGATFRNAGVPMLDYGNNIRRWRSRKAWTTPSRFPGFVPAYVRPLFCRGRRPVPLGGAVG